MTALLANRELQAAATLQEYLSENQAIGTIRFADSPVTYTHGAAKDVIVSIDIPTSTGSIVSSVGS